MLSSSLQKRLNDPSLLVDKGFVNGEWVDSGVSVFDVTNPSTGDILATLPSLSREQTAHAITGAKTAQKQWAKKTGKDRSKILMALYNLMLNNVDDLATILTAEMGKPYADAKQEITYGATFIQWYAEEAKRVYGDVLPPSAENNRLSVIRQPVGVVGAITPWNFPNGMVCRKIAPALAVGCAVVCLPDGNTPLSALAMAVLAERAGVPVGVLSVIPSNNPSDIGKELCENETVRKISFTGSTRVGRIIMEQCSPQIKKLSLELGGNAPFIIFDDADVDKAVQGVIASKFRNNGQTCVCANRLYVQSGIYDEFCEKLTKATMDSIVVGDGFDKGVNTGPLISASAVERVQGLIDDAVSKGATVLMGGKPHHKGDLFFEPTVIKGITQGMRVAQEEIFGPFAPIFQFDTEDEVIAYANDTVYGLAAYFFTNDLSRTYRVQESLEYGIIAVNAGGFGSESAPFGGFKQSGLGREGGKYGLDDYLETKYICTTIG